MAEAEKTTASRGRFSHSKQDIRVRTRGFALRIIRLNQAIPQKGEAKIIGQQLLRAGTSVGAHVAEAGRAKSRADFVSKIEGATQELEESRYWMDLLIEAHIIAASRLAPLQTESSELMAILVSMSKKSRES